MARWPLSDIADIWNVRFSGLPPWRYCFVRPVFTLPRVQPIGLTFPQVEGLSNLAMSRSGRIEQHAFTLLLAAGFALLLAFAFSGLAKAHGPSMHAAHQMHTAHNSAAEQPEQHHKHTGHHGQGEHNHGSDCPMHVGCDCHGAAFCNMQANGAGLFASSSRPPMLVVLPDRQIDVAPTAHERPPGDDHLMSPRSLPPPNPGWRTRLYSNIPRLRI